MPHALRTLIFIVFLLAGSAAHAAPVTWTVSGVFAEGGDVSGSFVYDAETDTYSAIDIVTGDFGVWGYAYGQMPLFPGSGVAGSETNLELLSVDANNRLSLLFGAPLTSAGGVFGVSGSEQVSPGGELRNIAVGTVTAATAPPVPFFELLGGVVLVVAMLITGMRLSKSSISFE